jgi:hypothetical protein
VDLDTHDLVASDKIVEELIVDDTSVQQDVRSTAAPTGQDERSRSRDRDKLSSVKPRGKQAALAGLEFLRRYELTAHRTQSDAPHAIVGLGPRECCLAGRMHLDLDNRLGAHDRGAGNTQPWSRLDAPARSAIAQVMRQTRTWTHSSGWHGKGEPTRGGVRHDSACCAYATTDQGPPRDSLQ